ncbi:uncharacterized protein LOC106459260 [Limulus polyphemus]|uniref:Uncharacterized protein LOC106459260 n=1 Tax=Limulus polyphemus TaxID=6850 RepID=A0ABM1B3W4_LIMPO|nr:uncharacterized protein LOC106459260 [Limulus polyphemus]XP_022241425.1 uncharacterized protein LOC106459260 [Limulus polyphemus]
MQFHTLFPVNRRRFLALFAYILFFVIGYLVYTRNSSYFEQITKKISVQTSANEVLSQYLIDTPGCRIPHLDPFDSSVKSLIHKVSKKDACKKEKFFIEVKSNAKLEVNVNLLRKNYNLSFDEINCVYKPILREPGHRNLTTDNQFKIGNSKILTFGVPLQEEFIVVRCFKKTQFFHEEYIALTPIIQNVEENCKKRENGFSNGDSLNVMIIGIDSISKLNFIRHFTKTHTYLRTVLKAFELRGYNKVGDNTFYNLTPLLTGFFANQYWNITKKYMFFDHLNFIWKEYSTRGYRTLFAEDMPKYALFNYNRRGFLHPPTDYYYRPFSLAVVKSDMLKRHKKKCSHSELEMQFVFDYVKQFTSTMDDKKYFLFAFTATLTHNVLNYAGYADSPSYDLLQFLHNSGTLNRTIMIFFSDHGIRFGKIRKTLLGKIEERMPFVFLTVPEWFQKKHPIITKNLRTNERRLTTPFDLRATLVHLLKFIGNNDGTLRETVSSEKGISLFEEIPINRTCADAFISSHWCVCNNRRNISPQEPIIASAANVLVDTLNHWLKNYSDKCAKMKLKKILDARVSTNKNKYVFQGNIEYLVTVITSPGEAVFEGTIKLNENTKNLTVVDDVSRINIYGNQSSCILDTHLKKFCFCV